jgi:hypothetical protein
LTCEIVSSVLMELCSVKSRNKAMDSLMVYV